MSNLLHEAAGNELALTWELELDDHALPLALAVALGEIDREREEEPRVDLALGAPERSSTYRRRMRERIAVEAAERFVLATDDLVRAARGEA